jgi:hypothetical protein
MHEVSHEGNGFAIISNKTEKENNKTKIHG